MTLSIHGTMPHASGSLELSETAVDRARIGFNPSGNEQVGRLKTLAAAFYSECEAIIKAVETAEDDAVKQTAEREAITAMTYIQAGAMFAVSAATAGS